MLLRVSARQSDLAKIQAYQLGDALKSLGIEVEYHFRESLGDKNLTDPLWKMPEKGVFTEDFYSDLITDRTDMVVHSWKDLPVELKTETFIAATLKRADQRDLLLFKPDSKTKKNLRIFSSSPRRAHNLSEFLVSALPALPDKIEFVNVRGNIQTRVRKLMHHSDVDGLILAKAAVDRLLEDVRASETNTYLKKILVELNWMILPLKANPNAAAQGALAVEIKKDRKDLHDLLKKINCNESYFSASREREILKEFGGGCHLALGMSVLQRHWGHLEIVKGKAPDGSSLQSEVFKPAKIIPKNLKKIRLNFEAVRKPTQAQHLEKYDAVYVSKYEAWNPSQSYNGVVWTSGIETWKKLAKAGVWVNGTSESLGEFENPNFESLAPHVKKWARLSHNLASDNGQKDALAGYEVQLKLLDEKLPDNAAFLWMSPLEFDLAVLKFPEIVNGFHLCGPGRTYEALKKRLGSDEKLYVELFLF
jgi:hydroxymethylbilane synthase